MKFNFKEHTPALLYLVRKAIESECNCGTQSSDLDDHTSDCNWSTAVRRHCDHSDAFVASRESIEQDAAKAKPETAEGRRAKAAQLNAEADSRRDHPATREGRKLKAKNSRAASGDDDAEQEPEPAKDPGPPAPAPVPSAPVRPGVQ